MLNQSKYYESLSYNRPIPRRLQKLDQRVSQAESLQTPRVEKRSSESDLDNDITVKNTNKGLTN